MPDQMADSPHTLRFETKQHDEGIVQDTNLIGSSRSEPPSIATAHEAQASPDARLFDLELDLGREAREERLVPGSDPIASDYRSFAWGHENGVGGVVGQNLLEVASVVRSHDTAGDAANLSNA